MKSNNDSLFQPDDPYAGMRWMLGEILVKGHRLFYHLFVDLRGIEQM